MRLNTQLLQIVLTIRSERQLVKLFNKNLLYRRFFGLNIEDKVWDCSTLNANRECLFNEALARASVIHGGVIGKGHNLPHHN